MRSLSPSLLRTIVVLDAALGWLLLLVSIVLYFLGVSYTVAIALAAASASIGIAGRFLSMVLMHQIPETLNIEHDSPFERYFAEQTRREETYRQHMIPVAIGLGATVLLALVGINAYTPENPVTVAPIFMLWAAAVFTMVVYTTRIDDIFAELPAEDQRDKARTR